MSGFIPEITTTVKVEVNSDQFANAINRLDDGLCQGVFTELRQDLEQKLSELDGLKNDVAETISQNLSSHQEQIISMKHYKTGMMANSVDVTADGDGQYLVGNTATSIDGFPYPLAIETGRREVTPINAKYLRWYDGGNIVFSKYSSAVPADPYVQPSIDATDDEVNSIIDNFYNNIFGE